MVVVDVVVFKIIKIFVVYLDICMHFLSVFLFIYLFFFNNKLKYILLFKKSIRKNEKVIIFMVKICVRGYILCKIKIKMNVCNDEIVDCWVFSRDWTKQQQQQQQRTRKYYCCMCIN